MLSMLDLKCEEGGSGTGHGWIPEVELFKLYKNGQFPDDLVN
jgi:hypothetical protein